MFHAITALLASIVAIFAVAKPGATPPPLLVEGPTGTSGATGTSGTKMDAYNTSSEKLIPAQIPVVATQNSIALEYAPGPTGATGAIDTQQVIEGNNRGRGESISNSARQRYQR